MNQSLSTKPCNNSGLELMYRPAYAFMFSSHLLRNQCDAIGPDRHRASGLRGVEGAASRGADERTPPMTVEYPFSLAQLAQILSALENERRNPNTKRNAIKAIARNAAQIGLTAEEVFDAADGLLSGRLSAAEFRAALRDEGCGPARFAIEPPAEPAPDDAADEPAEAYIMPNAGPSMAQSGM